MKPEFSERTFEFCYNAEYCRINEAILATAPYIPTQNKEKYLGYDVEFRLKENGHRRSVFLQHKVCNYVEVKSNNSKYWDPRGKAYYRFRVDTDQHNLLCELAQQHVGSVFYCSPYFYKNSNLDKFFLKNRVTKNCNFLNPLDVGFIDDEDSHNITYGKKGKNPILHSKARKISTSFSVKDVNRKAEPVDFKNGTEFKFFFDYLLDRSHEIDSSLKLSKKFRRQSKIYQAQHLLGHVFGVSWYLLK